MNKEPSQHTDQAIPFESKLQLPAVVLIQMEWPGLYLQYHLDLRQFDIDLLTWMRFSWIDYTPSSNTICTTSTKFVKVWPISS